MGLGGSREREEKEIHMAREVFEVIGESVVLGKAILHMDIRPLSLNSGLLGFKYQNHHSHSGRL